MVLHSSHHGSWGVLNLPADLAPTAIKAALGPLVDIVSCSRCREGIQQTVKSVVAAWVGIKVSFPTTQSSHVPNNSCCRPRFNVSHGPQSPMYYTLNLPCSDYTSLREHPWATPHTKIILTLARSVTFYPYLYVYFSILRNMYTAGSLCRFNFSNPKSNINGWGGAHMDG